ncbi:hypothetical protein ACIO3O_08490 [Streptomyces sp. NPDC087440]|uniref:hypothetical protein n=1 Tax=Streptomyces sp. NPDC087440 TaxID=3365790 RepID=UPI00380F8E9F
MADLPRHAVQNRWTWQLDTLSDALEHLDELHDEWLKTVDALPADASPGTPAYEDTLAEYHAEAWTYLEDWLSHGYIVREIHTASRRTAAVLTRAPVAATVHAAKTARR